MGKASKFKRIRRIASQMPVINREVIIGERVSGAELIKAGITESMDKMILEDMSYIKKRVVKIPINHNRQMKKIYNKHGKVGNYIAAVKAYSEQA